MYRVGVAKNLENQKRKIFALLAAIVLFSLWGIFSPISPAAATENNAITLSFANTPTLPTKPGNYQVELQASPNFPQPDPGMMDPSKVEVGVYLLKNGETFQSSKKSNYKVLFQKQYTSFGDKTTFTVGDYLPASSLPKPGDTLVPFIQTYAFNMATYGEDIKEFIAGEPYTFPGGGENPPSKSEFGKLRVSFLDENGQNVADGDFEIIQRTGTGTKETMDKMPFGTYIVHLTKLPAGYELKGDSKISLTLDAANPQQHIVFKLQKKVAPPAESIPYTLLTPILSPDHPQVFIRIENEEIHPINGLKVYITASNGNTHEVVDAKLNSSDETPHKILALPLTEFKDGFGKYKITLTQAGYQKVEVPFALAPRTNLPIPNAADKGYVYIEDGKLSVTTEAGAKLTVSFLRDPRLEEGIIIIDSEHIKDDGQGEYTIDFSHLKEQLDGYKHVKIVAQASDKAPSDIVTVRLYAKRSATNPDNNTGSESPDNTFTPAHPDNNTGNSLPKKEVDNSAAEAPKHHKTGAVTLPNTGNFANYLGICIFSLLSLATGLGIRNTHNYWA